MKNILVTGGSGFIGSNFIDLILKNRNYNITNLDKFTYAGKLENIQEHVKYSNYKYVVCDICNVNLVDEILSKYRIDSIINFAAETHVDNSISNANPFIYTNINGTFTLLELARKHKLKRFIQISTDEVYGSLTDVGYFTEESQIKPSSPYSASKAAGDLLAMSYFTTFGLPVIITRCSNNYGPRQDNEKLIPTVISKCIENKQIPVYGNGLNVRDWIYVDDHNSAILNILENGRPGEVYNIGASNEMKNIDIVKTILRSMDKPDDLISYVDDRLGHDKRYAINSTKIQKELYWTPEVKFQSGIEKTIDWYLRNRK